MVSLSEAARLAGQHKSTIWRGIKSGKLSATRSDGGDYLIDVAELHRAFPVKPAAETATIVAEKQAAIAETPTETALRAEIAALREVSTLLRNTLDDVKADRDAWRGQAQAGTLLLTHSAPEKRRWWRLVG